MRALKFGKPEAGMTQQGWAEWLLDNGYVTAAEFGRRLRELVRAGLDDDSVEERRVAAFDRAARSAGVRVGVRAA